MRKEKCMQLALGLAKKGRTSPNPKVGCVIVKHGKVLGKGYHKKAGKKHAEIEALENAKLNEQDAKESTMYITLEPCSHSWEGKKFPPCVEAIINSGIRKVVVGMKDPNPKVRGRGIQRLKEVGLEIDVGVMEKELRELNKGYVKVMEKKKPYVAIKMAMSLDGKIATESGESKWISGKESREVVQKMRNEFDAVMVGAGTILKDNPSLTCRMKKGRDPIKIIVDGKLEINENAAFMLNPSKVIIATTENANKIKRKKFEKLGVRVIVFGDQEVDLKELMKKLVEYDIQTVLIEGGAGLNASALKYGIVDRLYFFIAPKIIGGKAKGPVGGDGIQELSKALQLKNMKNKKIGEDILVEADV